MREMPERRRERRRRNRRGRRRSTKRRRWVIEAWPWTSTWSSNSLSGFWVSLLVQFSSNGHWFWWFLLGFFFCIVFFFPCVWRMPVSQAKTKWREFPSKGLVTELMPIGDLESNGTTNIQHWLWENYICSPFCAENSQILKSLLRE